MKVLVVIDMQNDFIDGSLGTKEAQAIVPKVIEKIKNFDGRVLATRDTHDANYLETQEGKRLPVIHCVQETKGWEIQPEIAACIEKYPIGKPGFGSISLCHELLKINEIEEKVESITLIGVCTDICVISNAILLKAFLSEVPIIVDASCCAGVTPETHIQALGAMKMCQIEIVNE